jgi:hypothetical protein
VSLSAIPSAGEIEHGTNEENQQEDSHQHLR